MRSRRANADLSTTEGALPQSAKTGLPSGALEGGLSEVETTRTIAPLAAPTTLAGLTAEPGGDIGALSPSKLRERPANKPRLAPLPTRRRASLRRLPAPSTCLMRIAPPRPRRNVPPRPRRNVPPKPRRNASPKSSALSSKGNALPRPRQNAPPRPVVAAPSSRLSPATRTSAHSTKLSASGSRARGAHAGDVEVRPDQVFGRARDEEASLVDQENRRVRGEVRLKPLDAGRPDSSRSIVRIGNICA